MNLLSVHRATELDMIGRAAVATPPTSSLQPSASRGGRTTKRGSPRLASQPPALHTLVVIVVADTQIIYSVYISRCFCTKRGGRLYKQLHKENTNKQILTLIKQHGNGNNLLFKTLDRVGPVKQCTLGTHEENMHHLHLHHQV